MYNIRDYTWSRGVLFGKPLGKSMGGTWFLRMESEADPQKIQSTDLELIKHQL